MPKLFKKKPREFEQLTPEELKHLIEKAAEIIELASSENENPAKKSITSLINKIKKSSTSEKNIDALRDVTVKMLALVGYHDSLQSENKYFHKALLPHVKDKLDEVSKLFTAGPTKKLK